MKEHDSVVLTRDIPEHALQEGDVGTVVHRYAGARAYEVEFLSASGKTLATVTLQPSELRSFEGGEILHVRKLSSV
jgi:hypothetical protein